MIGSRYTISKHLQCFKWIVKLPSQSFKHENGAKMCSHGHSFLNVHTWPVPKKLYAHLYHFLENVLLLFLPIFWIALNRRKIRKYARAIMRTYYLVVKCFVRNWIANYYFWNVYNNLNILNSFTSINTIHNKVVKRISKSYHICNL